MAFSFRKMISSDGASSPTPPLNLNDRDGSSQSPGHVNLSNGSPFAASAPAAPSPPTALGPLGASRPLSQIIAHLPKEFLRQGVTPPEVAIPLVANPPGAPFAKTAVRLSEVYQRCSSIFARPVSPETDQEIPLPAVGAQENVGSPSGSSPFQKVDSSPPAAAPSPFSTVSPSPSPATPSPFSKVEAAPAPPAQPQLGRKPAVPTGPIQGGIPGFRPLAPEASGAGEKSAENGALKKPETNPFAQFGKQAGASPEGPKEPAPAASPFSKAPTPPASAAAPAGSPFGMAQPPTPAGPPALPENTPPGSEGATLQLGLSEILSGPGGKALGISSANVPEALRVALPLERVSSQLSSGRVAVRLSEIVAGLPADQRALFAGQDESQEVQLPLMEVFRELPDDVLDQPSAAPKPPADAPPSPFSTPFSSGAQAEQRGSPFMKAPGSPAASAPSPPAPAAAPALPAITPFGGNSPAPKATPAPAPSAPQPAAPAALSAPVAPTPPVGTSFDDDDYTQLELRAIFGLTEPADRAKILALVAELPGVKKALALDGQSEGDDFAASAKATLEQLSALTRKLGIDDASTFAIQTSNGLLSFFTYGNVTLAILHDGAKFAPGVREKLIICTRELAAF
ncbi:MAG: hypothetical protein AAF555_01325 [Verrucomicrobiota bacterium]